MASPRVLTGGASVRVEGLAELNKALGRLDAETRGNVLGKALLKAAEPIEEEWARLAPRSASPGGTYGKGHAADHIRSVERHGSRDAEVDIGPESDFFYLVFSEFGTPHSAAVAPGRRAADAKLKESVETFRAELRGQIDRAVR